MSVTMHTWRLALPEITQSLSHSKSLTPDSRSQSDTDTTFPYWDKEADNVTPKKNTPQMYLEANKDDNGGKKNTGSTCCHARMHPPTHTHAVSHYDWSHTHILSAMICCPT